MALKSGAVACLAKPFNPKNVLELIRKRPVAGAPLPRRVRASRVLVEVAP